jgi:hypothetical protein
MIENQKNSRVNIYKGGIDLNSSFQYRQNKSA